MRANYRSVLFAALIFASTANAAKIPVSWVNPTQNNDGTPLTDLAFVRVEWGSCAGSAFGTLQASVKAMAPANSIAIYPTGLTLVCIRAFAVNSTGVESISSNIAQKSILNTPGKPVTLGQPVILSFNSTR